MFDSVAFAKDGDKVLQVIRDDMATIRTGRAKPSFVENVMVEAYGTRMRLMELAMISAPDTTMIIVAPWDKSLLSAVEKGIASAGLNLSPVVDGDQIRIIIPALTEDRRKDMVKLVYQKLEGGKQMIRDVRQKHKKIIEDQKGKPGISEDDIENALKKLQENTDVYIEKLETLSKEKEEELMQM
ncbi:MAG: ribosome recycling factor [Candidatus Pacebacteria bacterium]|nr:ribosome recycling factor [Candidatus Paceibacterota bacterium]